MSSFCRWRHLSLLVLLLVQLSCSGFTALSLPRASQLQTRHVGHINNWNGIADNRIVTASSKQEEPPSSSSTTLANYHLIWSPRVWKKMLLTTLSLWITLRTFDSNTIHWIAPTKAQNSFLFNALLPTLSSACCWIQIVLNAVTALGCAGFNTYLGPLRPFFLSLLTYLTIVTRQHTRPGVILLRWSIALLPEFLHFWNTTVRKRKAVVDNHEMQQQTENESTDTTTTTTAPLIDVAVYLDCPTMGCVACVQKVNSSLQKALQKSSSSSVQQIQAIDSWLLEGSRKGGKAKIRFSMESDNEEVDPKVLKTVVQTLKKAGFPCKVDVVRANRRK